MLRRFGLARLTSGFHGLDLVDPVLDPFENLRVVVGPVEPAPIPRSHLLVRCAPALTAEVDLEVRVEPSLYLPASKEGFELGEEIASDPTFSSSSPFHIGLKSRISSYSQRRSATLRKSSTVSSMIG